MTKEQEEAIEMLEDIKNNTWTTKYIMSSDSAKAETVLSMLKHNSAEIEQKNTELAEKNAEIEKKDKQIDLMAEEIKERKYVFTNKTKKDIKQYFERKSENEN